MLKVSNANEVLHPFLGAEETLVLNMSKLVMSVLTSVKGRVPLASEVTVFSLYSVLVDIGIWAYYILLHFITRECLGCYCYEMNC